MLLAGAGLLMRSFVALQIVDLGMNPNNVLVARLPLPRGQYTTASEKQRFFRELLRRLHEVPEIESRRPHPACRRTAASGATSRFPAKRRASDGTRFFSWPAKGIFNARASAAAGPGAVGGRCQWRAARRVVNQTLVSDTSAGRSDRPADQIQAARARQPIENPSSKSSRSSPTPRPGHSGSATREIFIPYTVTGAFERGIMARTHGDPAALMNASNARSGRSIAAWR